MNSFTQSIQDSMLIVSLFIAALFVICTVSLALRNYEIRHEIKKLKTWRKFSEIEKKQKHEEYDQLATELAEERAFNDTQGSMHVRLMLKYAAIPAIQKENEKLQGELKIIKTCLKVAETEITDLKAKLSRKNLARDAKGRVLPKYAPDEPEVIKPDKQSESELKRESHIQPVRDWTQASKDELLAEAKRRGFVKGAFHTGLTGNNFEIIQDLHFVGMDLYGGEEGCIFDGDDGQWAKIIPNA